MMFNYKLIMLGHFCLAFTVDPIIIYSLCVIIIFLDRWRDCVSISGSTSLWVVGWFGLENYPRPFWLLNCI